MSQPEENSTKTNKVDDVLMRTDRKPLRNLEKGAPRDEHDQGEERVARDSKPRNQQPR